MRDRNKGLSELNSFVSCLQEKLKKLLDETRPLQLAFVKDKAA